MRLAPYSTIPSLSRMFALVTCSAGDLAAVLSQARNSDLRTVNDRTGARTSTVNSSERGGAGSPRTWARSSASARPTACIFESAPSSTVWDTPFPPSSLTVTLHLDAIGFSVAVSPSIRLSVEVC